MGIEYKIVCEAEAVKRLEMFLRKATFFDSFDEEHKLYNLRFADTKTERDWPDVVASIESDGVYVCDNLSSEPGNADHIIRAIIDEALKWSESITIHEP